MSNGVSRLRALLDERRPLVMGAFNVTPDSFHDGGRHTELEGAVAHARRLVEEGADLLDIGGESTRPGAEEVPLDEERRRVLPLLERVLAEHDVPVSVDTGKPELMREAIAAGAAMINDVRALRVPGAIEAVAENGVYLCLMHMQGEPRTMQRNPHYDDVIADVGDFLEQRVAACVDAGIDRARLVVDPGFGFGKTLTHNLTLLKHLDRLVARFDRPLLVGLSRKRMIGQVLARLPRHPSTAAADPLAVPGRTPSGQLDVGSATPAQSSGPCAPAQRRLDDLATNGGEAGAPGDVPTEERLHGSLAVAVMAVERGARIVRAHDVRATREALALASAVTGTDRAA